MFTVPLNMEIFSSRWCNEIVGAFPKIDTKKSSQAIISMRQPEEEVLENEVVDELDSLLQELDLGYEHRLETFWKLNNAISWLGQTMIPRDLNSDVTE